MKNFKVFYRKKLLRQLLARIKLGCKTYLVINNVDFNEANLELFIDGDSDGEFTGSQSYISWFNGRLLPKPRRRCSNISKRCLYTSYKLEEGNKGKTNSLRDWRWWRDTKISWGRTEKQKNKLKSSSLIYCIRTFELLELSDLLNMIRTAFAKH